MAAFEYEALDTSGKRTRGMVSADSARMARRELRRRRLVPMTVIAVREKQARAGGASLLEKLKPGKSGTRISARELAILTRQLAVMLDAAAPVEEALNTVARQSEKPAVTRLLLDVRAQVMEGRRLSEAMARQNGAFSPLYCSMVAAGESLGSLGTVFDRLAEHLERSRLLKQKVQGALTYPAVLSLTAIGVVIALMTLVVPKVVEQFQDMGQTLPLLTRIVIALSDAMVVMGPALLVVALVAGVAFGAALRKPAARAKIDAFLLKLPLIGKVVREVAAARMIRTLATLTASGIPVVEGLAAVQATVGNSVLRRAVDDVMVSITEGASLSGALRKTGQFPQIVVYMAAVGEQSGRMDDMLARAADYMDGEFAALTETTLRLFEPALIVLMGLVVGTIVMAIVLPIMQLNTLALL